MASSTEVLGAQHSECFDVITAEDGSSTLHFNMACATAMEHYTRNTTATAAPHGGCEDLALAGTADGAERPDVCSTGLRVYEGAQVLSAFLCRYGLAFSPLRQSTWEDDAGTGEANKPSAASETETSRQLVVELGCGCGLVGFTASAVFSRRQTSQEPNSKCEDRDSDANSPVTVVFTDASEPCLRLVRRTGELNGLPVLDGGVIDALVGSPKNGSSTQGSVLRVRKQGLLGVNAVERLTFPLAWDTAGVQRLQRTLAWIKGIPRQGAPVTHPPVIPSSVTEPVAVDIVLGSDILYYRVDIQALLRTVKQLLLGHTQECGEQRSYDNKDAARVCDSAKAGVCDNFCVLCHVMRIPDGRRKLAKEARALGFALAEVPLHVFLSEESVVQARGWGNVEVVVMCLRAESIKAQEHATAETDQTGRSPTHLSSNDARGIDTIPAGGKDEELRFAHEDGIQDVKAAFKKRIAWWRSGLSGAEDSKSTRNGTNAEAQSALGSFSFSSASRLRQAISQAEKLHDWLQPYGSRGVGAPQEEAEENDLLHLLL